MFSTADLGDRVGLPGEPVRSWTLSEAWIRGYTRLLGGGALDIVRSAPSRAARAQPASPFSIDIDFVASTEAELRFKRPTSLRVSGEGKQVVWEVPELALRIEGDSDLDAEDRLLDQITVLRETYLMERDENLTPGGRELKRTLGSLLE